MIELSIRVLQILLRVVKCPPSYLLTADRRVWILTSPPKATAAGVVELNWIAEYFDVDLEAVRLGDSSVPADLESPTGLAPLDDTALVSVSRNGVGEGELTFEITAGGPSAEVVATKTIPLSRTRPQSNPRM